ncbi:DUF3488 and DUF4129 domain-containing transglutaminase family protein, partial [Nitrospirota bacterium]
SFDMREPWDPLQVYFMSILQIIITSELSLSIIVGVFFGVFLVLFMVAMVFSHFMKEGTLHEVKFFKAMAVISVGTLFFTVTLFVIIPRVSGGLWGRKASTGLRSVGFGDSVELGSYGRVLDNPSIVMRVELEGGELPLYWRGITLDHFDGVRWSNTLQPRIRVRKRGGLFNITPSEMENKEETSSQRVIMEPLDTDVIFGLGEVLSVKAKGWFLYKDASGSIFMGGRDNRRISYTVRSRPDRGNRGISVYFRYLQLPERMERIKKLAETITEGLATDSEKAEAIMTYLSSDFSYTLSPGEPAVDIPPMEWFLFESREGYCEHFSTAMALMLRTQGIPSRIVTGFLGGEENELGNYIIVRQRNAHSWLEAGIDGKWVRFDPTPVSSSIKDAPLLMALDNLRMKWYRYVIGFSSYDQISMLSSLTVPVFETPDISGLKISVSPVYIAVFASLIASAFILMLRRRTSGRKVLYSTKAYLVFRRSLKRRGGNITDSLTPEEVADEAIKIKADPEKVLRVTSLYLAARFGDRRLSKGDRELLRVLSKNPFPEG